MSELNCKKCDKEFGSLDALTMHNKSKHFQEIKKPMLSSINKNKMKNWIYLLIVIGIISGLIFFIKSGTKILPPTDLADHMEEWPDSQIQKSHIPIPIFKHILEHTDTPSKRPGVVISYNCEDYDCDLDLIEKLEEFTAQYDYVYVAPFEDMSSKIVITKFGKQKLLDEYSEESIKEFIE